MRQPATPSPVAAPARRARPPAREQRKFRLWPHTPSRTHTLTQLYTRSWSSSPGLTGRSSIPEAVVLSRAASGILAAPPSRGMTAVLQQTSIRVLALGHQRQRRLQQDVGVEQRRPVLDVIEVELDA